MMPKEGEKSAAEIQRFHPGRPVGHLSWDIVPLNRCSVRPSYLNNPVTVLPPLDSEAYLEKNKKINKIKK